MDELELLKKDWQENQKFPKLSKQEIYALLHKKSSSIVKWIFILSLIEFSFWTVLGLFMKDTEAQQRFDSYCPSCFIVHISCWICSIVWCYRSTTTICSYTLPCF